MPSSSETVLHGARVHARVSRTSRRHERRTHADARDKHDNVQTIFDAYADYNGGDGSPSLQHWHEDAEYRTAPEDPDCGTHRGIDAIARLFASWREVYPDLRVEVREARERSNHVFAWVRFIGRGAASGVPIQMELAHVATMRDGRTMRLVEYNDRAEALRAIAD